MAKRSFKDTIEDMKIQVKWKWEDAKDWCRNHQAEITVFGPIVISGAIELIKVVTKKQCVNEEKNLKENYIYDRSAGHYYELRRKPKSSEWRMIDNRKNEGELLGDILEEMKLLK